MKNMAKKFLDSEWADGVTMLLAAKEQSLLEKVEALADASGLADPETVAVDEDVEDRAEQMKAGVEAIITGDFATWFVLAEEWGDRPERLAALADSDVEERMTGWIAEYRDNGVDLNDRVIVRRHVEQSFGISTQGFARAVHWPDSTNEQAMRRLLVGHIEDAEAAIQEMTAAAREATPGGQTNA